MKKSFGIVMATVAMSVAAGAVLLSSPIEKAIAADDPVKPLDPERGAYVVRDIFNNGFAPGTVETWNTGPGMVTTPGHESESCWKQPLRGEQNSEIYWEFGEGQMMNFKDTTDAFNEEGALEFYVKTNSKNNWFKCYAFTYRENPEGDKGNQKYNRSEIDLTMYIDKNRVNEWQFVQIPVRNFSTRGAYVDGEGTRQTTAVDVTKIIGIGFAQLSDNATQTTYYDHIRFTNLNLPDKYLGCKMVQADEFERKIKDMDITKVNLAPYATAGFTGGSTIGWSGQGEQNELTGFDLFGHQEFGHIPYYIVDPATNNGKAVIGLRNDGSGRPIYTQSVTIPVDANIDGFYMIHNVSWGNDSSRPSNYIFNYSDGSNYKVELQTEVHIFNWWGTGESDVGPIYWTGTNQEATEGYNMQIKINGFACVNKHPEKKVTSLTFEVAEGNTVAEDLITALTLVDNHGDGLLMPYLDNPYNPDTSTWYEWELPDLAKIVGSPLDVSYLLDPNSASGIDEKGHIIAKDGGFAYEKSNEKVRFNGVNVNGNMIYDSIAVNDDNKTNHEHLDMLCDILAAYGYNMVRIMAWDDSYYHPNLFENPVMDKMSPHYGVNERALDAMFYFINGLKEKGIYVQFSVIGGRNGSTFLDLEKERRDDIGGGGKFEIFLDNDITEEVLRVVKMLLTETNPYSKTKLAEDAQLALVEMANEDNFSNMYGLYTSTLTYEFNSEYYRNLANTKFTNFVMNKYGTIAKVRSAWSDPDGIKIGLKGSERESGIIVLDQSWMSDSYTDARRQDTFNFLYEQETNFYLNLYNRLIGSEFNITAPITATTNLPTECMQDLYINAQYDYIARHHYASHPTTGTEYQVGTATGSVYSQAGQLNNLYQQISGQVMYGQAYICNETNIAEPNRYSSEFAIMNSAIYSYQGWSVCTFSFSSDRIDSTSNQITNSFSILNMPTRMGTLTGAALLFYSGEIAEATEGYFTGLDESQALYEFKGQTWSITAGLYLVGKAGVYFIDENGDNINKEIGNPTNNDALLERINHQFVTNENETIIYANDGSFFAVNTPSTQSVIGQYGDKEITLNDMSVKTDNRYATVTLSALKKQTNGSVDLSKTIATSDHLLLNAAATMRNTGAEYSTDGREITGYGDSPILVEPVTGEVTIRNLNKYDVYALDSSGQRTNRTVLTTTDENGFTVIHLRAEDKTMNYEIVRSEEHDYQRLSKFYDVNNVDAELLEKYGSSLQSITKDLYMLDADVSRGDFLVSLVKEFGLELKGDTPQYADVDSHYYGYNELRIARSNYIYYPPHLKPYESLTVVDECTMLYNFLTETQGKKLTLKDAFVNNRGLEELLSEEQVAAINYLYGSGYIKLELIDGLKKNTTFTRRDTLNLLKQLKEWNPPSPSKGGCGGSVMTTSLLISSLALIASGVVAAIIIKKRRFLKK